LEWDYTFLISLSDDSLPSRKGAQDIIGERRLFYVAVTRARQRMFMTYHGNERALSRFVREIGYQLLTFHGLAKYALSEFEVGGAVPSLQSLLDCLDGDEWAKVREAGLLPWREDIVESPLTVQRILPSGESYRLPSWADQRDFEAFLRLWLKRCLLELGGWQQEYTDPMRERMIFTVRIFQEDAEFWSQWRDEFDQMMINQEGKCYICKGDNGSIALCIDHDHLTGKVRGLLCNKCNRGLGLFSDDLVLLKRAMNYLIDGVVIKQETINYQPLQLVK
jgi:hypothetical protein